MEQSEFSPKLLDTEAGMFFLEISEKVNGAYELIDASNIDEAKKAECRKILERLVENAEKQKENSVHPYDLARPYIESLLVLLDKDNNEENQLFEAVRNIILNARDSVLSWGEFKPKK
jgi:hypothetical protein